MNDTIAGRISVSVTNETLRRLDALVASIMDTVGVKAKQLYEDWTAGFGDHLQVTFDRCTKIKTILHTDEPAILLDQYVNVYLKCNNKSYSDYDFINEVWKRKNIIITGTGGGGKTILMRYLWISFFENPKGKVPLFIELRGVNTLTGGDLISFIFHSVVSSRAKISQDAFNRGIENGLFILMLDGFDEIIEEKRAEISQQIVQIAERNPNLIVIVSSRPDDRFDGWQPFSKFEVLPLEKTQVVTLIEKLDYDLDIKRIFLKLLREGLYERHKSFLSTPLLAIIMLITFKQFADIPEKIHVFYEQAFDTLHSRHDAIKGGYKRKSKTGLAIHDFKRLFSYFCLVSYYATAYEFDERLLSNYLEKAIEIDNSKVSSSDFLSDLILCVCLIQKDGLKFIFSHRSFQEFFCAFSLAYFPQPKTEQILERLIRRGADSVMPLLHDMNPLLIDNFIIPRLQDLLHRLKKLPESMEGYTEIFGTTQIFSAAQKSKSYFIFEAGDQDGFTSAKYLKDIIRRIYGKNEELRKIQVKISQDLGHEVHEAIEKAKVKGRKNRKKFGYLTFQQGQPFFTDGSSLMLPLGPSMADLYRSEILWLSEVLNELLSNQQARIAKIDTVFGL